MCDGRICVVDKMTTRQHDTLPPSIFIFSPEMHRGRRRNAPSVVGGRIALRSARHLGDAESGRGASATLEGPTRTMYVRADHFGGSGHATDLRVEANNGIGNKRCEIHTCQWLRVMGPATGDMGPSL